MYLTAKSYDIWDFTEVTDVTTKNMVDVAMET